MSGLDLYEQQTNERLSRLSTTDTIAPPPWTNDYLLLGSYVIATVALIVVVIICIRHYRQSPHKKQENRSPSQNPTNTSTTRPKNTNTINKVSGGASTGKAILWVIFIFIFSGLIGIAAATFLGAAIGSNVAIGTMLGGIAWVFSTKEGKALKEKDLNPFKRKND